MADPQPDQGFFPGLLGKVGNWFGSYDPQAAYGGLLSDPEVKQQFRLRELGAVAASMAANSMPVPYKGGMPWGSFLGAAGGAAATAGDSLMKARLEAAQAGLANQTVEATKSMMPMYQALFDEAKRNAGAGGGGAAGTGAASTGAPGAPAKGTDITPLARLGTGDTKSTDAILSGPLGDKIRAAAAKYNLDPVMLAAQVNAESSGDPTKIGPANKDGVRPVGLMQLMPDTAKAMGVKDPLDPEQNLDGGAKYLRQGLDASNGDLPNALKFYYSGSTDPKSWGAVTNAYPSRVFALAPKPDQTAAVPGAPAPAAAASPAADRRAAPLPGGALDPGAEGYTPGPQGLLAPPSGAGPIPPTIARNSRGEPYAPLGPGEAVAAGAPGASPVITPQQAAAANAGGGNRLPVMPSDYIFGKGQVAPPGAGQVTPETAGPPPAPPAGAPGPVGGLLNPEPGAAAGLSPAAAAIAQGMTAARGGALPPSGAVAGPGAPSEPPPPAAPPAPRSLLDPNAGMEGGPPLPTGAVNPQAGPPGLMTPQGPAAPGPQATPPVTQVPQAAPRSPFPPVGPPPQLPALPSQMPQVTPPQMPQATPGQAAAMGIAGISALIGKPAPEWIQQMAAMPGQQAMETFRSWLQVQQQGMTARDKAALDLVVQPYLKQVEAATAAQYKTEVYRPGAGVGIGGQPPTSYAPEHITAFNPATQRMEHATQTNQPNGPPIIQFSGVPSALTPFQTKGSETVAQKNAEDFQTVTKEAAGAPQTRDQATFMRQEAKNFYTGPGAAYNQNLNKVLLALDPSNPDRANKVASYEAFIKDAGYLSRAQAKETSSKTGVQELQMVAAAMPGDETSPRGLDRVLGQIQGMSDYRLAKQMSQDQYVNQPGRGGWDNNGFETQFNANVNPYAFMYMRLSDQDRAEIRNQLAQTKAGQADLQRLQGQIKYITDNNLLPR